MEGLQTVVAAVSGLADSDRWLDALQDRYLLNRAGSEEETYTLNDIYREYACDVRLTAAARAECHRRAAEHELDQAGGATDERTGVDHRFEALYHFHQAGEHGRVLELAGAVEGRLDLWGLWDRATEVCEWALEAARVQEDQVAEARWLNSLGIRFYERGAWAEAIQQYEESLAIFRELGDRHGEATTLMNLAEVHEKLDRPDQARRCYGEAAACYRALLEHSPDEPTFHRGLAAACLKLGEMEQAREHLQQAVELEPDHAWTWRELGLAHADLEEREASIRCYRKAVEIDPEYVDAHGSLGWALYEQGDYAGSVEASRRALELDPEALWIRFNLALARLARGDRDAARIEYEKGLAAAQSPDDLAGAIQDLEAVVGRVPGAEEMLALLQAHGRTAEVLK